MIIGVSGCVVTMATISTMARIDAASLARGVSPGIDGGCPREAKAR